MGKTAFYILCVLIVSTVSSKENEYMEIDLARIPKRKTQRINVKRGMEVYAQGGHTQMIYREFVCDTDQETVIIY